MSDNRKNATLKAIIDAAITELMIKTSGEQIYLDGKTTLSSKMAEMVAAINLRDKKTDVDAKIEGVNSNISTLRSDLSVTSTKVSTLETELSAYSATVDEKFDEVNNQIKTHVDTADKKIAAIDATLETKADKTAVSEIKAVTDSLGALSTKDKVSKADLDTVLQNEINGKAETADVNTKVSNLESSFNAKISDANKAINLRPTQTDVTEQIAALKQEIMGDLPVEAYDTFTELAAYINEHQEAADALTAAVGDKADKSVVDDILTVINALGTLAKKDNIAKADLDASLQTEIDAKATKVYVDEQISTIDTSLSTKSDTNHTHDDRYYTETEIDTKLKTKSDTDHTHDLNTMINTLPTGSDTPVDADYYISQYTNGGTTNTTYHRRPVSTLWSYIKGKADKVYAALSHKHTKADITDFPTSMPASDVPDWAKAATKPTYTKSDIGLGNVGNFKAVSTVANQGLTDDEKANARSNIGAGASTFSGSYDDLSNKPTLGTAAAKNVGDFATATMLTNQDLNNVVTPGFYTAHDDNTVTNKPSGVNEFGLIVICDVLGEHYVQILYDNINSTSYRRYYNNDAWTSWTEEKLTDTWRGIQNNLTSDSTSDSLAAAQGKALKVLIDGKADSGHTHDDRYYTESEINSKLNGKSDSSHTHGAATQSLNGFMSSADKTKLDGIADGANKTTVDSALSSTSTNPVQNKVINTALAGKSDTNHTHQSVNYATSAGNADTVDGHHFNWSGKEGQPTWLWGGNDSTNMYVYNPSNFNVYSAKIAGSIAWSDVSGKPSTYSPSSHTHDDRYYTESEIDTKLNTKSNTWHNHDNVYVTGYINDSTYNTVSMLLKISSSNNAFLKTSSGNYIFGITLWSDERIKKNVIDSSVNALKKISQIKMREFDFIDEKYGSHTECGYVAQELKEIFPECVISVPQEKEKFGYEALYQVNDTHMIPYLVKAIQELNEEVEKLKANN